jgi:hypothetical protein
LTGDPRASCQPEVVLQPVAAQRLLHDERSEHHGRRDDDPDQTVDALRPGEHPRQPADQQRGSQRWCGRDGGREQKSGCSAGGPAACGIHGGEHEPREQQVGDDRAEVSPAERGEERRRERPEDRGDRRRPAAFGESSGAPPGAERGERQRREVEHHHAL